MDPADVVATYGASWAETDEAKRRELLERAWTDDGVYVDPSARAEGRDALIAHIGGFQEAFAGHRIEIASGVDTHGDNLRFAWRVVGPSGDEVMEGVDFGRLAADGRLCSITGFFGPWPA
jgi:hypothetical protein